MPDVRMPNGTIIKNVPKGITQDQLLSKLGSSGLDTKLLLQAPKEKAGFLGSLSESLTQFPEIADEVAAYGANPNDKTRRALIKAGESKYKQVGFGEGDNWEAFKQLLGGSLGQMAAPVAAGLIAGGETAATVVGAPAAPFVGIGAAALTGGAQYTSQNLLRQAQEQEAAIAAGKKPEETSVGKAVLAATGQTALDLAGGRVFSGVAKAFPFMRPLLGRAGGKAAQNAGGVLADAAENGTLKFAKGIAYGTGKGVAFEIPQEVAQQGLERWQAGKSLFDKEAQDEYGQAAMGALLLGGGLGGVSGGLSTRAKAAPTEEAPITEEAPAAEGEAIPTGERKDVRKFQKDITSQLAEAAGPQLSVRAKNAINSLGSMVSSDLTTATPESLARSQKYIQDFEDEIDGGKYEPAVADRLLRPKLAEDGTHAVDETTGKPIYEGALAEAKRMVEDARKGLAPAEETTPTEEAAPVELTPASFVDRYVAGEGRGDTDADRAFRQYHANNAADIEAEFARRVKQREEADAGVGRTSAPIDEGTGAGIPPSSGPESAGTAPSGVSGVGPEAVGVGGVPPVSPSVGANAEPNTLTPAPKMEVAPNWLVNIADKFGQAELADNWAKSTFGEAAVPTDLQTAPILERTESMQAGQQRDLKREKFDPIVETAANLGVDIGDFNAFLWFEHAAERNREVAKSNEQFPEGGAGITTAAANEGLQEMAAEGVLPKYKILKKKVQDLVKYNLQEDVKAELLSQAQVDAMPYENYVPLKGFAADNDIMTAEIGEDPKVVTARRDEAMRAMYAASPGGNPREFRRAMGRGSMPHAPLFNLMQDSEQRVRRRVQNMARLPILRQWKKRPAAFDGIINVYTDANPKMVARGKDRAGTKYEPANMESEYYSHREDYMIVKDKGVTYYVEFNPTESGQALRRMFENMNPKSLEGMAANVAQVNNFLKGMLTYKNPLHLIFVAPFRDISSAIATAMHHQNLKGSPAYKKNLAANTVKYMLPATGTWGTVARYVFTNKPMDTALGKQFQEFIREGGAPLHARLNDVQDKISTANLTIKKLRGVDSLSAKERISSILRALNERVDNLADLMDMSARFATYRAAREVGILAPDAARLSLDSSLNLTRRGEKARQLDLIFPFFATGVEATRKTKRMLVSGRGAVKILGALIAYGAVESMINAAISGDDDDDGQQNYLEQNNTMRMGRAILYYGEGADEYVKLPIDPMLGYFKFVGNRIGDLMLGNATPGDVTSDLFFGAASTASPVRVPQADAPSAAVAFTPLVGKPFMENILNKNFFGGPIYKESQFDNAPRSELGNPATSDNWKWLARTINDATGGSEAVKGAIDFQPEVYRHLMEGYLGGPYQIAKQMAGLGDAEGVADIPGIKSFVGSGSEYAPQTKYFENSSTIRQIMNRLGRLTPEQRAAQGAEFTLDTDPRIIEAYQIVDKELDKVGKEQTETLAVPGITAEEKQLVLDHYRAKKNELYSAFNSVYNVVKKAQ